MALRVSVSKHILDSFVLLFIPRARKSINAKIPRASTLMPYLRLSKAITVTVSAINQCVLIYHYYLFSKTADLSNPEESFFFPIPKTSLIYSEFYFRKDLHKKTHKYEYETDVDAPVNIFFAASIPFHFLTIFNIEIGL